MIDTTASLLNWLAQLQAITPAGALRLDSREVEAGDVFVACPGRSADGRDFIADAIANGAMAVLYETSLTDTQKSSLGSMLARGVPELRSELGGIASAWYGHPSAKLKIVAITGTNGKTTTAQWLAAAWRAAGLKCGVIGTLGVTDTQGRLLGARLTTPDVVSLHGYLAQLQQQGATHVVMEASSIGLEQGRLDGVQIDVGVFTNLTQDHLDYHQSMSAYAQAKALLFSHPHLERAVINLDDSYAPVMRKATKVPVISFGVVSQAADVHATNIVQESGGQRFTLTAEGSATELQTPFVGSHAVSNMLAVAAVLLSTGWSLLQVRQALQSLPTVPGRLEPVELVPPAQPVRSVVSEPRGASVPHVLVDYAHTPDALTTVLQALRPLVQARGGKLWCVVGCGGARDPHKRPMMARVAFEHADRVIFTSDNPRHENPDDILRQMSAGVADMSSVQVQADRAVAILQGIWQADAADVILLAGKGHEQQQEIAGVKHVFDDRQWARLGLLLHTDAPMVQTDTRQLTQGAIFVALRGDRFDGHNYLDTAKQAGARAAIVETASDSTDLPQLVLGPTLKALQTLARAWRTRFSLPVIGITGSNGKTTTKEMTAAICHAWAGAQDTLSTVGNLNNEIGVPLTLLRLRPHHRVAVIEMGMNHPGEIALLASIAQPTVAVVLNAQREHQEFMHSVEAVANENAQALVALPADGVAIFPADDAYSELWATLSAHTAHRITFGQGAQAVLMVSGCRVDATGSAFEVRLADETVTVKLPVAGFHNVLNATAAMACATAAGIPLVTAVKGLSVFKAVKGRLQVHRLPGGEVLIDDTYNANPDSVRAAIDVLTTFPAPRALVLGDMGEVGENGAQMHAEVGLYARDRSIDYLWALGDATRNTLTAFGGQGHWFDSPQSLCEYAQTVRPASVLVKGSRFMAMERVVNQWLTAAAPTPTHTQGDEHAS